MPTRRAAATDRTREVDVCIVGAGPAGLSVASALLGSGLSVAVLESGQESGQAAAERLGAVDISEENPYPQTGIGRTRGSQVGGTAGIWSFRLGPRDERDGADGARAAGGHFASGPGTSGAGTSVTRASGPRASGPRASGPDESDRRGCRYAPLDELDMTPRPGVRDFGWPLRLAELVPWYEWAQIICGLGEFRYDAAAWAAPEAAALPLDERLVRTSMFQFGPASAWTRAARDRLQAAGTTSLLTGATVLEIEVDRHGGEAEAVRAVMVDGSSLRVRARAVVVAAGGIENARLLMLSDSTVPGGIGNAFGQVGQGFMEHPLVRGGLLVAASGSDLGARLRLYDLREVRDTAVMGALALTQDVVRREDLLAASALLLPRHRSFASAGVHALSTLRSPIGRASGPLQRARLAARAGLGATSVIKARAAARHQPDLDHPGWSVRVGGEVPRVFEVVHQTEQTPHPDNRVLLGEGLDRLGRRRPVLAWRWREADRRRVAAARDVFAHALEEAGLGRVIRRDWDDGVPRMIGGTHHHMGGTRMSADPAEGVVDADCRVHGMSNVFVAGSSVFPSGGYVNPTLTVVALALRLGSRLQESLTGVAPVPAGVHARP